MELSIRHRSLSEIKEEYDEEEDDNDNSMPYFQNRKSKTMSRIRYQMNWRTLQNSNYTRVRLYYNV